MAQYLVFDTSSGVSGDMAAGALLALCDHTGFLADAMEPFHSLGYDYQIHTVQKAGRSCISTVISGSPAPEAHHHSWNEIMDQIELAHLTPSARDLAVRIYQRIAAAESAVHGVPADRLHFHEVGSMRAVLNVIAFAAAYDHLGIRNTIVPSFYEGTGTVLCSHGVMEVPVPAVCQLLEQTNIPLTILKPINGEILTPTGCACLSEICTGTDLPNGMTIRSGYGAGKRDTGLSGILEVKCIETDGAEDRNGSE